MDKSKKYNVDDLFEYVDGKIQFKKECKDIIQDIVKNACPCEYHDIKFNIEQIKEKKFKKSKDFPVGNKIVFYFMTHSDSTEFFLFMKISKKIDKLFGKGKYALRTGGLRNNEFDEYRSGFLSTAETWTPISINIVDELPDINLEKPKLELDPNTYVRVTGKKDRKVNFY